MTKSEILTLVGQQLGDTNASFLSEVLSPIFNQVISELALKDCLSAVRRLRSDFNFTAAVDVIDTKDMTGLSADWPRRIERIQVPAWLPYQIVYRADPEFEAYRSARGPTYSARPEIWRYWPGSKSVQVFPIPDADSTADDVEVLYIAPATVLAADEELTELRMDHVPAIVAGCRWFGLPFQEETMTAGERTACFAMWQDMINELRRDRRSQAPGPRRVRFNPYA